MKKTFLIIAGSTLALLIVLYIGASFFLGSLVKAGVNRFGSRLTQTEVVLAGAEISPFSGQGTLTGLLVGNPKGWASQQALAFGKIHLAVAPGSVFSDCIVINEIDIEDPEIDYETRFVTSNIGQLLSQIEGGPPPASGQAAADQGPTKGGKPLKFEVKHFVLHEGHVTVGMGSRAITLAMPTIELNDLGVAQGGFTAGELSQAVMRSVIKNVVGVTTHAATKIGSTLSGAASDAVKGAKSTWENLLHH